MNPHAQFCHTSQCPARGQRGQGNIRVHSDADQRYRCTTCGQTFAATKGTPFYRLHTAADLVTVVLTLVCHGCPLQAIVAAFGLDERTVAAWVARAGQHCQQVHQHVVQQGQVDLQHVQADELWVKLAWGWRRVIFWPSTAALWRRAPGKRLLCTSKTHLPGCWNAGKDAVTAACNVLRLLEGTTRASSRGRRVPCVGPWATRTEGVGSRPPWGRSHGFLGHNFDFRYPQAVLARFAYAAYRAPHPG
jgi:transposase-like protein